MSSVAQANPEKTILFETIFSSPGMSQKCKINFTISRQNILLLARIIEVGLLSEKVVPDDEIISALRENATEDFSIIHEQILDRGELKAFYQKLKML